MEINLKDTKKVVDKILDMLKTKKALIVGLTSILMLVGCGYDQTYKEGDTNFSSAVTSGGEPLDDTEMAVALRICYAFRSKRTLFLAQKVESNFNFTYRAYDCDGNLSVEQQLLSTLKQLLPGGPLSYESTGFTLPYMREVETDISGHMESFCDEVFKGNTPLDVIEENNEYFEYEFLSGLYDTFIVRIGSSQNVNDPTPIVTRIHQYEVLTNSQPSGDYTGMVVRTSGRTRCEATDSKFKRYEQSFIAP
ncbi:MAG: hypothetical protein VXV96_15790 [Bdellovibrionota bacterium]|nr:hypothetical protein [Bdellovibrionota bacterium]